MLYSKIYADRIHQLNALSCHQITTKYFFALAPWAAARKQVKEHSCVVIVNIIRFHI